MHVPANTVLGVAWGVKGLDDNGAEGEAGVVGGRLGDGVGVFAADYGELLVGIFGELGLELVYIVENREGVQRTILRFPPAWSWWLEGGVRMVGAGRGNGTHWWVFMTAVRLISPEFTRVPKVGITL